MFPCPDFVRQLIEYFQRFFAPVDHDHDADYSPTDHGHDDTYYTESEVDTLLSGKADDPHGHDDTYYTESEVDTLLSGKANDPHDHNDTYYTESEVDTLLSGKSDTGHTHTLSLGKVKQVVVTELSLSFPFYTSGTSEQQIPNFGINVNITTGKVLVLLTLPMFKNSSSVNANITSSIDVGGLQRKKIGQHFFAGLDKLVVDLGGAMWFVDLGTGYKYVSVFVEPTSGPWQTADQDIRQPRLTVIEFE